MSRQVHRPGFKPFYANAYWSGTQLDKTVHAPVDLARSIFLEGVVIASAQSGRIFLEDNHSNRILGPIYLSPSGTISVDGGGAPIWVGASGDSITATSDTANECSVTIWGYEEYNA